MRGIVALAALLAIAMWLARDSAWVERLTHVVQTSTAHEAYRSALEDSGLDRTSLGRAWISAAAEAMELRA